MKYIIFNLIFFFSFQSFSDIPALGIRYLKRSPKDFLLGGAYTARATEDHTLMYNPATLGRHSGLSFYPFNVGASATNILSDSDRFDNIDDDPVEVSNALLNYPVHVGIGSVPGLKFGKFGISAILAVKTNALMTNKNHPVLDLEYRYDNGFVTGFAFQIGKSNSGSVHLGIGAKYIKRKGLADRYSLMGTRILNAIDDSDDYKEILKGLGYSVDNSWGGDIGLEYHKKSGAGEFAWGIAAQNIGMNFKTKDPDASIPEQAPMTRTGLSYTLDSTFAGMTFSFDLYPLNIPVPVMEMVHVGIEFDFPIINLFAGYNGVGPSYGAEIDLFAFRVIGGFYTENVGSQNFKVKSKRFMIYASLLDFSFDA